MQDADEPVGELAEGGLVAGAAGAELVVVGAGAGGGGQGGEGLAVEGVTEVLGEFGDDPYRYTSAKARKNYAAASPITRQSGKKKTVTARHVHNDRYAKQEIKPAA